MTDKIRKTFPIRVTHIDGEQPVANKLNSIADQARNGLAIIEGAVGDIWNQAGDEFFSAAANTRAHLQIATIGRNLGESNYLSPIFDKTTNSGLNLLVGTPQDTVYNSKTELPLPFPATNVKVSAAASTVTGPLNFDGQSGRTWFFDSRANKYLGLYSTSADLMSAKAANLSYSILSSSMPCHPSSFDSDLFDLTPNVLPPVEQSTGFTGCKIIKGATAGYYYIFLPPRQRLSLKSERALQYPVVGASNENLSSTDNVTDPRFFWLESANAPVSTAAATHYRYRFPSQVTNLTAGNRIPDGFIKLEKNGRVLDGIVFSIPTGSTYAGVTINQNSYCIQVYTSVYQTDLDTICDSTGTTAAPTLETPTAYQSTIRLLVTGTSHAEKLMLLEMMMLNHQHNSSETGFSRRVAHYDLDFLNPTYQGVNQPGAWPFFPFSDGTSTGCQDVQLHLSNWEADDHLGYIHRAGSKSPNTYMRDIYNNAILGDLLIGSTSKGASVPFYNNQTADSYSIYFGSIGSSSYSIEYDKYFDSIQIDRPGSSDDCHLTVGADSVTERAKISAVSLSYSSLLVNLSGLGQEIGIVNSDSPTWKRYFYIGTGFGESYSNLYLGPVSTAGQDAAGTGTTDTLLGSICLRSSSTFQLATGLATRLTILSTGEIGIGTNAPTGFLHVLPPSVSSGSAWKNIMFGGARSGTGTGGRGLELTGGTGLTGGAGLYVTGGTGSGLSNEGGSAITAIGGTGSTDGYGLNITAQNAATMYVRSTGTGNLLDLDTSSGKGISLVSTAVSNNAISVTASGATSVYVTQSKAGSDAISAYNDASTNTSAALRAVSVHGYAAILRGNLATGLIRFVPGSDNNLPGFGQLGDLYVTANGEFHICTVANPSAATWKQISHA
jgi:hypothetical protein